MKDTELIKRHEVKGTPFMIVETKENGCFIHLGMYRVSKVYRTVKECRTIIKAKPWDVIIAVAIAMTTNEMHKHNKEAHGKDTTPLPMEKTGVQKPEQNGSN